MVTYDIVSPLRAFARKLTPARHMSEQLWLMCLSGFILLFSVLPPMKCKVFGGSGFRRS